MHFHNDCRHDSNPNRVEGHNEAQFLGSYPVEYFKEVQPEYEVPYAFEEPPEYEVPHAFDEPPDYDPPPRGRSKVAYMPWFRMKGDTREMLLFTSPEDVPPDAYLPKAGGGVNSPSFISINQFFNVYDGLNFLNEGGKIANVEATVVFGRLGLTDEETIVAVFATFRDRLRAWCRWAEIPCVLVHAFEFSDKNGLHCHMQLFVPPERHYDFRGWYEATWQSLRGAGILPKRRNSGFGRLRLRHKPTVASQWHWTRYCLKALDPLATFVAMMDGRYNYVQVRALLHLRDVDFHPLGFERVGISKAIGPGARRAVGFRPVAIAPPYGFDEFWTAEAYQRFLARTAPSPAELLKQLRLT